MSYLQTAGQVILVFTDGFQGTVALITGAASGLGAGTARHLLKHGARVVIMDLPQSNGETLAKEMGENCLFAAADVRILI